MVPHWFDMVARFYVPLSLLTAVLVLADIFLLGRRQHMAIMNAVWPLTMLYWGPLGLIFYGWFGRAGEPHHDHGSSSHHAMSHERPMWQATFNGATHCGAGCALGDVVGDWLAFATGLTLFGSMLGGSYVLAFLLAYALGILFQFFSVAPMQGLGVRDGLVQAVKIDTLSLLAYEIGMFGFMGVRAWLFPHVMPTDWSYWLFMQIAMVLGFATTYPVNWWLISRGTKEKM